MTKDTVEDCEKWCQEHHQCTAWKFYKGDESKQKKYCALMDDTDLENTLTVESTIDWDSGIVWDQKFGIPSHLAARYVFPLLNSYM